LLIAADDVTKLLKEVGASVEKENLDAMMRSLQGKQLHDLVRDGSKKLASVPAAGKTNNCVSVF
jgi:large subunit ribosomal protein LP2